MRIGEGEGDNSRGGGKGLRIGEGTRWWFLFLPLTVELEKLLTSKMHLTTYYLMK